VRGLQQSLSEKADAFKDIVKIGRTHLMDVTPPTMGQESSGYAEQVAFSSRRIEESLDGLYELALGGSAVGTWLNTRPEWAVRATARIADLTGLGFQCRRSAWIPAVRFVKGAGLASFDRYRVHK
jgi:fumarate hydratase, class II